MSLSLYINITKTIKKYEKRLKIRCICSIFNQDKAFMQIKHKALKILAHSSGHLIKSDQIRSKKVTSPTS